MNNEELLTQLRALKEHGLTFTDCVTVFGETTETSPYVAAAKLCQIDGELEFDDPTVVSEGDDAGAYVMAWYWIPNEEDSTMEETPHDL